jgi:hypothetical protein
MGNLFEMPDRIKGDVEFEEMWKQTRDDPRWYGHGSQEWDLLVVPTTSFDGVIPERTNGIHYPAKYRRVLRESGYRCFYCGDTADTVDHIIPRAKGGTDDIDNLVAACLRCNCAKGIKLVDEFLDRN